MIDLVEVTFEYLGSLDRVEWINRELELGISRDITIISGPRRVGKTFLMLHKARELIDSGENVVYVCFDEPELRSMNVRKFAELVRKSYPSGTVYLFLDEIQEWVNWDYSLRWLHDIGDFIVYVSGSSSTLHSSEIPSRLRGRYILKTLLPLSLREIIGRRRIHTFRERGYVIKILEDYIRYGGFPEIWVERRRDKIIGILDTIFYRDVIERYRVRDPALFREFLYYVLGNYSNPFTYHSLRRFFKGLGIELDIKTIINYIYYLQQAFLIDIVYKYSPSIKERIRGEKKLYLIDHVFANLFRTGYDLGRILENMVYTELLRRKYYRDPLMEIYFYRTREYEIDFIVRESNVFRELIEVTYSSDRVYEKARSLVKARDLFKARRLLVITWDLEDTIRVDNRFVDVKPLWKWLLGE